MDKSTISRLTRVHPELSIRVEQVIADLATAGLDIRAVQGLRTYKEQNDLYAQGRSKKGDVVTQARGGFSNHNFGLAVDLCPFDANGKPDWNNIAGFNRIGQTAVKHGLAWGGNWKKFIDKPHVELPTGLTITQCRTLFEKGGLNAVWDRASKLINSTATVSSNQLTNIAEPKVSAVTAPSSPSILLLGSKGQAVRNLQKALGITITGTFDKPTDSAVRGFQRTKGLRPDGKVGKLTRKELGLQ